jgi:hypothetical protein
MENQDWKLGLREEMIPVFEAVSQMEVVKGLYLCGGTRYKKRNEKSL